MGYKNELAALAEKLADLADKADKGRCRCRPSGGAKGRTTTKPEDDGVELRVTDDVGGD